MRDTKLLEEFKKKVERKLKEMNIFKNLRKEVETGANGTQSYICLLYTSDAADE
mgnify:CR=1 FL=1